MQSVETRCENCSAEVLSDDLFCQECGERTYADARSRRRLHSPQLNPYREEAPARQDSRLADPRTAPKPKGIKLPSFVQAALSHQYVRVTLVAMSAIGVLCGIGFGIKYAMDYPKFQALEKQVVLAEQCTKDGRLDEAVTQMESLERTEGKLDTRQRACLDLAYALRADRLRASKNYAGAIRDIDRITPAFMHYKLVQQERHNMVELDAQQKLLSQMKSNPKIKGTAPTAAPAAAVQLANEATLTAAAAQAAQAQLPAEATGDTNFFSSLKSSIKSTKPSNSTYSEEVAPDQTPVTPADAPKIDETIVGAATDADVAKYNKLLAGYFSRLPAKVVELREPPSFREWMSSGKKDF